VLTAASSLFAASCGEPATEGATLPPIATTSTTSTTVFVPTTIVYVYHEVQSGETLFKIAENYGVTVDEIIAANNLDDPDHIEAGATLRIPPGDRPVPPPAPTADPALTATTAA
jgi:LysM repeat protein